MRIAPTDDTLRVGPLAAAAGTRDDGRPPDQTASEDTARRAERRAALTRELGAITCAVIAITLGLWSLYALSGWPALGLGIATLFAMAARSLGYGDPTR